MFFRLSLSSPCSQSGSGPTGRSTGSGGMNKKRFGLVTFQVVDLHQSFILDYTTTDLFIDNDYSSSSVNISLSFYFCLFLFTEKGGTVFRPIVKSRSRVVADNRQSSIVPDGGGDNNLSTNPTFDRVPEYSSPGASNFPPTPETSSSASLLRTINPNVVASTSASSHTSSFVASQQPAIPSITSTGTSTRFPSNQPVSVDTRASSSQSAFVLSPALTQPSRPLDQPSGRELRKEFSLPGQIDNISHSLNAGVAVESPASIPTTSASIISYPEAQTDGTNLPLPPPQHMKRKRKAATSSDTEESDEEADISANKSNRRASSGALRARKSRPPSLPPFDADADPGEEIDPTVVTMASLCDDTGQGRVSRKAVEILTNHAAWKAQNREKRARMKTLMEQKKYGREETDDVVDSNQTSPNSGETELTSSHILQSSNPAASTSAAPLDDTGGDFDYSQHLASSRFNVQVRIGPNGETIIDEESLVVDRAEVEGTENYTHVVESDNTKFINSGSYGKRFRGSRWSAEETESFYDVSTFPPPLG